jgi:type 1 glutamine amidotransferase
MIRYRMLNRLGLILLAQTALIGAPPIKVLIVDGQNNHKWQVTTPILKKMLEDSGRFTANVATSPPRGGDMSGFKPEFAQYDVILGNYNGAAWPVETQAAFEQFVHNGGGFVSYHAADNAFRQWKEYNLVIGIGGWGNRNETDGPYLRYHNGAISLDNSPGPGGHHGKPHRYKVVFQDLKHPIAKGLPIEWMHGQDELYDSLRGPARNVTVLATAYSDPATGGTGLDEPVLLTVAYGKGRVFHTVLGHEGESLQCAGFITTLLRGAEWAATGKVTQKRPRDFPTAETVSLRP